MFHGLKLLFVIYCCFWFEYTSAQTVYITENGKKYHKKNCQLVQTGKKGIHIKEALGKGYEPCKACKPELAEAEEKKKPRNQKQ